MFDIARISVIVLTFNRKNLLKETVDSILAQTFKDFELIIVDNCSSDGTEEFVKSYTDLRIRYFKNANNGIIAVNLNYGIERANGEYIALCDDDDLWFPSKLEKQVEILDSNKEVALVCTNGTNFNELGDQGICYNKKRSSPFVSQLEILIRNFIIQSSVLFRKSILEKVGGAFDISPAYFTAEEFELWLRILKDDKIYFIEEPLMKYRTHAGVFRSKGLRHLMICKKIVDDLWKKGYISKKNYVAYLMRHYAFYAANITGFNVLYRKLKLNTI